MLANDIAKTRGLAGAPALAGEALLAAPFLAEGFPAAFLAEGFALTAPLERVVIDELLQRPGL